jgi:hypothetical protein
MAAPSHADRRLRVMATGASRGWCGSDGIVAWEHRPQIFPVQAPISNQPASDSSNIEPAPIEHRLCLSTRVHQKLNRLVAVERAHDSDELFAVSIIGLLIEDNLRPIVIGARLIGGPAGPGLSDVTPQEDRCK